MPNWFNMQGGAGCGGKDKGDRYGYDAARTPWRVAMDYVWNGTPAAKDYLTKLVTWVDGPAGGITSSTVPKRARITTPHLRALLL